MAEISTASYGSAASGFNLADISAGGSISAKIAVFASSLAQNHRKSQKEGWETNLKYAELERTNMLKQADEMRQAAVARLAGAITQGVLGVAGGVAQGYAAVKAIDYARQADQLQSPSQTQGQGGAAARTADGADELTSAAARSSKKSEKDTATEPLLPSSEKCSGRSDADPTSGPSASRQLTPDEIQAAEARSNAEINSLNNKSMAVNQGAAALGMITNSMAQMGKGVGDFIASIDDAQKMELEADKKLISAASNVNNQRTSVHGEEASKLLDIAGQAATAIQPPRFA